MYLSKIKLLSAVLLLLALVITTSCNHESSHDMASHSDAEHSEMMTVDDVKLDNGQKWQADQPTNENLSKMNSFISSVLKEDNIDPIQVKKNLSDQFNTTLKQCTMKGEAHNQLHVYLVPLQNQITELNEESSKAELKELHDYLSKYNNYFK